MRVYRSDGSFVDDPDDKEFGWFLKDIVIDEATINYQQRNRDMKMRSFLDKSQQHKCYSDSDESLEKSEIIQVPVEIINPQIAIQPVKDYVDCEAVMDNLFAICNTDEFMNFEIEKEKLANNLNPCSVEARMLLCIIHNARFKLLQKKATSEELMKSVNFKSTKLKFILSDQKNDFIEDIINYHETKEDSMLSLMMELISSDVHCDVDNLVATNDPAQPHSIFPRFVVDTSDLGNSISSSSSSREEKCEKHSLNLSPDKSNILSSLGLCDEERSIQYYCEETYEMHKELANIRNSFRVSNCN